jgi:hypothetical protein
LSSGRSDRRSGSTAADATTASTTIAAARLALDYLPPHPGPSKELDEIQCNPSIRAMGVVSTRGDRPLRSGCRRGRLVGWRGRNCPGTATGRWWSRERFVAGDAVVVPCRVGPAVAVRPLVPVRPVGVLLPVAHCEIAVTPLPTRAPVPRQLRLVRVWRISAGNRSRRHNRRSTAQHGSAKAAKSHLHFDPFTVSHPHGVSYPRSDRQHYQARCRQFQRGRCRCLRSGWAG